MQKVSMIFSMIMLAGGCSVISELTAFKKCEFSFHSIQDPSLSGIEISDKRAFSDFSLREGQKITLDLLNGKLPLEITVNVEARNPGPGKAAVSSIQWIALIDQMEIGRGTLNNPVEVPPNGGRAIIPLRIHTDLFNYLEGENPRTMFNFALNLVNAGDQPTRLSLKIKPSVLIGQQSVAYPGYITLTEEFSSGD